MNFPKLKTVLLGISCLAVTSAFAQDTSKAPKSDTTKWPKHDSTSMNVLLGHNNVVSLHVKNTSASLMQYQNLFALKNEAEDEIQTKKSFIKISS